MRVQHKLLVDYYIGGLLHTLLKPVVCLAGFVLRRDHRLDPVREICFIKLLGGGSLVIAYPALLALKRSGRYRLQVLTSVSAVGFAEALGVFDEIITINDRGWISLIRTSAAAMKRLFRHDALVDLEIHSRLSVLFSIGVCAVNRVGFYSASSYWRRGLSTHLLFFNRSSGIYHFYDQIAELFGCNVPLMTECRREFCNYLGLGEGSPPLGDRPINIGVCPGCSDLSVERMLTVEQWVTILLPRFSAAGNTPTDINFIGGPKDRSFAEQIITRLSRHVGSLRDVRLTNCCGQLTVRESLLLIARLDRVYCIDSGLMHFARLMGVRTESFWGPTSPAVLLRDVQPEVDTIHYWCMACSPCVHVTNVAPCKGNNVCMKLHTDRSLSSQRYRSWVTYGADPNANRRITKPLEHKPSDTMQSSV